MEQTGWKSELILTVQRDIECQSIDKTTTEVLSALIAR